MNRLLLLVLGLACAGLIWVLARDPAERGDAGEPEVPTTTVPEVEPTATNKPASRTLDPAAKTLDVHGIVVDWRGLAIGDAEIWGHSSFEEARLLGRSDAKAAFALIGVPRTLQLEARKRGLAPSQAATAEQVATAGRLVLPEPGAGLRGRVTHKGQPLPDARVRVTAMGAPDRARALRTAGDGTFVLDDLAPGTFDLRVVSEPLVPWQRRVEASTQRHDELQIALDEGWTVVGVVRDEAGQPLEGVRIDSSGAEKPAFRSRRSEIDGSYATAATPVPPLHLAFSLPGHANKQIALVWKEGSPRRQTLDVTLPALPRISGRLQDADGKPLARTWVEARATKEKSTESAQTDAQGRFEIPGMPGLGYRLFVRESLGPAVPAPGLAEVGIGAQGLVVTLPALERANAGAKGQLADATGKLLAGVRLDLKDEHGRTEAIATTDAEGRFTLGPLPRKEYELRTQPRDAQVPGARVASFTLAAGEQKDLGSVRLPELGLLQLEVRDGRGGKVTPRAVLITTEQGDWSASLKEGATASPQALPPGRHLVSVRADGCVPESRVPVVVHARETAVLTVTLRDGVEREFAIDLPRDQDLGRSARLRLERPDGTAEESRPLEVVPGIPLVWTFALVRGRHVLSVTTANGRTFRLEVVETDLAPREEWTRLAVTPKH